MNISFTDTSEASFSSSGLYRWSLSRRLNNNIRTIIFIVLNPSKASASKNDPTLRRLINLSSSWGYGNLIVVNLFARISSSASFIRRCTDPIGKKNDQEFLFPINEWSQNLSFDLWLGWGNQGTWQKRNLQIMEFLKKCYSAFSWIPIFSRTSFSPLVLRRKDIHSIFQIKSV